MNNFKKFVAVLLGVVMACVFATSAFAADFSKADTAAKAKAEIKAFDERWHETVPSTIEDSVATLAELKAKGEAVYAITNFSREKWAECLIRFPFLQSFDGVIVSAHERLLKPDPRAGVELVDRAHRAGLEVYTWTLRPENKFLTGGFRTGAGPREWGDWRGEFDAVLATGLDGVFADQPDLAVAARDER